VGGCNAQALAGKPVRAFLLIADIMKIRASYHRASALPIALAATFYASTAFSQNNATVPLKETVVTANRVQQDVQSAPFSAIVLTNEQIVALGASDANEAIRRLTGIPSRTDLRGGRNYRLDLMGYGETADQNVVVIIDGVRISENEQATARLSAISAEMIESIEIIRGGSSVQWGEAASAGLINVTLKKNVSKGTHGSATIQAESFGGRDVRAQLLGGNGSTGFDLTARNYKTDGYRDNSKNTQQTLSAGVNGTAGGLGFRARISTENEKSRFSGSLSFAQFDANPRQTVTPDDFGNFTETRASAGVDYRLGAVTLALDVANRDRKSDAYFVGFGFNSSSKSKSTQISPKLTYVDRIGSSALTVVAGLDFNRWDYNSVDNFGQNEDAKQTNSADYLTGDLLLSNGTRITVGSRREKVNKTAFDPFNFVSYDRNDNLNAWDFGINQALSGGLNIYGRTAKAYRLPNVDENRFLVSALRPQITRDIDAGLKWQSAAGSSAGVRAFRQSGRDEIAFDPTTFSNVNLDPTRRNGLEINGRTVINRELSLSGSIQSITAKFSGGLNSGKEIPLVSQMSAALRIDWQIDARQRLGVGAQYLGEARFGDDNANTCARKIPASTLLDARYAYKLENVEFSVAADNLGNSKNYSYAYDCVKGSVYPNPGRVIKLAAKFSF
jgi:iron complex outermembrane receptor protein